MPDQPKSLESMSILAKLADINIETKEIVGQFLLLTYDIPCNKEGNLIRRRFLDQAHAIGAVQHTASVYLLPWTQEAEAIALELATMPKAHVLVWTSKPTDELMAKELTDDYDVNLEELLDKVRAEITSKVVFHADLGHDKQAARIAKRLVKKVQGLRDAAVRRGSERLTIYALVLEKRLEVY
jgi:hypothetical protein